MTESQQAAGAAPADFTKKPVTIQAILWTGENIKAVMDFMQWRNASHDERTGLLIHTLEGNLSANIGDWIIRGVKGEFYACKPDIFAATYDQGTDSGAAPAGRMEFTKDWCLQAAKAEEEGNACWDAGAPDTVPAASGHVNAIADSLFDHQRLTEKLPPLDREGFRELIGAAIDADRAARQPIAPKVPAVDDIVSDVLRIKGGAENWEGGWSATPAVCDLVITKLQTIAAMWARRNADYEAVVKQCAALAGQPIAPAPLTAEHLAIRAACSQIIKSLAGIVNSPQTDEQVFAELVPRNPLMVRVQEIKSQVDAINKVLPQPVHPMMQAHGIGQERSTS